MPKKAADIPEGMRWVYGRFARWRKLHTGRLPIPDSRWASAAEPARNRQPSQASAAEYWVRQLGVSRSAAEVRAADGVRLSACTFRPPRERANGAAVLLLHGAGDRRTGMWEHGVFRTAKVLRLEYGKLKRLAALSKEVARKKERRRRRHSSSC